MPSSLLIANGIVVDPPRNLYRHLNVVIVEGRIQALTPGSPPTDRTFDATGCFVCPGFIDMHVHLREPGLEHKETIATGLAAAARGGFTGVAPMPNTRPVCDSPRVLKYILDTARISSAVDLFPICAITRASQGRELAPIVQLASLGCRVFSNDGQPVDDAETMRQAMEAIRDVDGLVVDHCEDRSLAGHGVMHAGAHSGRWNMPGISPLAEEVHIARDILLAEETGCAIHIAHLSTARGVDLVRWAKQRGIRVTAEVTPHHLTLAVDDMPGPNPDYKMNPPLRTRADQRALINGLRDGTIDVIATDHAPHSAEEKARGFVDAPFGIVGLETAISLVMDQLYHPGILTMEQIVNACAIRPATLLRTARTGLSPGNRAMITIIDPDYEVVVHKDHFASRSGNTPFEGWRLKGAVRGVVLETTLSTPTF